MAENKKKRVVTPIVDVNHNEDDTGLQINIDLAGASKETVDLDVGDKGFCLKADAEDFRYESCFRLAHEVKAKEAIAKFTSGLLKINVPFKESWRGFKVSVS